MVSPFWQDVKRQVVLLAAGHGTRIRSVHGERSKCLIAVGDQTILDCQLDAPSTAGAREVAVVVGYKKEQIISHVRLRRNGAGPQVHFIENPAFALTKP